MDNLEAKDSTCTWSIVSAKGVQLSTTLPKVVRTFEEFTQVDIYTGDIDPTYWAINRALQEFGRDWTVRFCVGMLTYYHTGTAVQAASYEGTHFWDFLRKVYPTAPRAAERRHFRGPAGQWAINSMQQYSPNPARFFDKFKPTYAGVKNECASNLDQFGPYFVLKICDYMDRGLEMPIQSYVGLESNLPSLPLKAVKELHPNMRVEAAFEKAITRARSVNLPAPPLFDRPIGPAEVETILCDWKRARTGSSWVGADVEDKKHAFSTCNLKEADLMASWMPEVPPRNLFKLELE